MRYYNPNIKDYQSLFTPLPLEYLQKSLDAAQGNYDKVADKGQAELDFLANLKDGYRTQGWARDINDTYKNDVNNLLAGNVDLGSSDGRRQMTSLISKIRGDQDLKTLQEDYTKGNPYFDEFSKKDHYDKTIDPNTVTGRPNSPLRQLERGKGFSQYQNPTDYYNILADFDAKGAELKADVGDLSTEDLKIFRNSFGKIETDKTTGRHEFLNPKMQKVQNAIKSTAENYLANGPGMKYFTEDFRLKNHRDPTQADLEEIIANEWATRYFDKADSTTTATMTGDKNGSTSGGGATKPPHVTVQTGLGVAATAVVVEGKSPLEIGVAAKEKFQAPAEASIQSLTSSNGVFAQTAGFVIPEMDATPTNSAGIPGPANIIPAQSVLKIVGEDGNRKVTLDTEGIKQAVVDGRITQTEANNYIAKFEGTLKDDTSFNDILKLTDEINASENSYAEYKRMDKEIRERVGIKSDKDINYKIIEEAEKAALISFDETVKGDTGSILNFITGSRDSKEGLYKAFRMTSTATTRDGIKEEFKKFLNSVGYESTYFEDQFKKGDQAYENTHYEVISKDPKMQAYFDAYKKLGTEKRYVAMGYNFGVDADEKAMQTQFIDAILDRGGALKAYDLTGELITMPKDYNARQLAAGKGDVILPKSAYYRFNKDKELVIGINLPDIGPVEVANVEGLSEFLVSKGQVTLTDLNLSHELDSGFNQYGDNRSTIGAGYLGGAYRTDVEQLRFDDGRGGKEGQYKVLEASFKDASGKSIPAKTLYFDSQRQLLDYQQKKMGDALDYVQYVAGLPPEEYQKLINNKLETQPQSYYQAQLGIPSQDASTRVKQAQERVGK